jgi:ACS family glucarate transporter-like MFS transporter
MRTIGVQVAVAERIGSSKPTNVRWAIMSCIVMVTVLTYLDRLNLGIAGKYIQDELSLSTHAMGWVFSAFLLGYSIFQVPGGWAGDRYGPKNILTGAILAWSLFTALTGLAPDLILTRWIGVAGSLIVVRFLVGIGEAASSPNNNKIVANWIGLGHRGFGSSFTLLGIGIGGALTPPLIAWIMQHWGWRSSFYISGLFGLLVALIWEWYVSNTPEEHPQVNAEELAIIQAGRGTRPKNNGEAKKTPWKEIISNRSVWGLSLGYLCQGFPIYFYHTWFFIYLVRIRHLSITEGGFWGSAPYVAIALLAPTGGWFSDKAVARIGKRWGRRLAVCLGMFASAILIWTGGAANKSTVAISLLALGAGCNMFAATTFWATCIDLTEDFTGSLSGFMNTFGNLGGWLSPIVSAYVATHFGWNRALDCAAVVSIVSALFFLLVRADQRIDKPAGADGVVGTPQTAGAGF